MSDVITGGIMRVIAKANYPFEKGKEYKVAALVLEGYQGEWDPSYFEFVGNTFEACSSTVPIIGEPFNCRRREIGSDFYEPHLTTPVEKIERLGSRYFYFESQNNRYWLRLT